MKRRLLVILVVLCLFGGAVRTSAQEGTVYRYTLADVPQHLIIVRGAVVEFSGNLAPDALATGMQLLSRNIPRDQGQFTDHWTLRWDSGKEPFTSTSVSVWQDIANVPTQRLRIYVRIIDAPPFRFTSPAPNAPKTQVFGPLAVMLETTGALKADRFLLTVDGKPTLDAVSDTGKATWNPEGLTPGEHTLGALAVLPDGENFPLAPIEVLFVGRVMQIPLETGDQIDTTYLNGDIPLRALIAPDIALRKVAYYVDADLVAERTAPPFDLAEWNPATVPTGPHVYHVEVSDNNGNTTRSPGYPFTVQNRNIHRRTTEEARAPLEKPAPLNLLDQPTDPDNDRILRYPLTDLPPALSLSADMSLKITGYLSFIDSRTIVVQDHDTQLLAKWDRLGDYTLTIDASKLKPGVHPLRVAYPIPGGGARVLARCTLTVYPTDPVQIVVPKDPKDLLHRVTLTVQTSPNFAVQSVTYYKDFRPLTPCPDAPLTALWDARRERPGDYMVWAVVTSSDGSIFKTHPEQVHIPVRVSVAGPKYTLALTEEDKFLPALATIVDGLTPVRVEYLLDGQVVATQKRAPFDRAVLDASAFPSGVHKMVIRVIDDSGAEYLSEQRIFGTAFTDAEVKQVEADVEKRIHLEELARLRRQNLDKIRDRIARVGTDLYKPVRTGQVGRVNGLVVWSQEAQFSDGHSEFVDWGQVFNITSRWVQGTGKVQLNVSSDVSAQSAAARAVACCSGILTNVNWSTLDTMFDYQGLAIDKVHGDSAGVANTTSLMLTALHLKVDSSVAMTGAIDATGNVGSVGGVIFKAEAALSQPSIRTLIVPKAWESARDIEELIRLRPELFVNRHLVYAARIKEVFRQAIIGYDPAYEQAQRYYRSALSLFIDGEDEDALAEMQHAAQLTPEDVNTTLWVNIIGEAAKEPVLAASPSP